MRRFWTGITVMTLLLALGIFSAILLPAIHRPMGNKLEEAAQAALAGNWAQVDRCLTEAKAQWDRSRPWTAALVAHDLLEEAECLFAEAAVYAREKNRQALAAACTRLAQIMDTIAKSHQVSWQNFL